MKRTELLLGEPHNFVQNIGNFKTLNEIMDGITRWEDLYNRINQIDLTDSHRTLHKATAEDVFSQVHMDCFPGCPYAGL